MDRISLFAPNPPRLAPPDARLALAALLVRVARSDGHYDATEAAHVDLPRTERGEFLFKIDAEAIDLAGPVLAHAAALVTVAAQIAMIGLFRMIAEAGNVETVRAAAVGGLVRVGFQNTSCTDTEVMVHQIAAERSAFIHPFRETGGF